MGFGINEALNAAKYMDETAQADETASHLKAFQQQGAEYRPQGNYNGTAYHNAQMDFMNERLKSDDVQKMVFEKRKRALDESYRNVKTSIQQAEGLISLGNLDEGINKYQEAYGHFIDGTDMSVDGATNTLTFKTMNGQEQSIKFNSQEEMIQHMRQYGERATADPNLFAHMGIQSATQIKLHNADRWQQMMPLTNKDGRQVMMVTNLVNTWDGQPLADPDGERTGILIMDGNRQMTIKEALKGGYITMEQLEQYSQVNLRNAQAANYMADAKATTQNPQGTKGMGSEEKLANAYVRAYGVSFQQAMDMVRQEKTQSMRFKEYMEDLNKLTLDLTKPEDQKTLEQIRMKYGVQNTFRTDALTTGGKGLPKPPSKPDEAPSDPAISALEKQFPDAKDGTSKFLGKQKYTKENGKWVAK